MNELNYPETTKHVIIHDNEIFTYHIVEPQNCLSTGQPFMEIFDSEEEAKQFFPQAFLENNIFTMPQLDTENLDSEKEIKEFFPQDFSENNIF
jgi:hypothetical protein